jgi:hypothetical protein
MERFQFRVDEARVNGKEATRIWHALQFKLREKKWRQRSSTSPSRSPPISSVSATWTGRGRFGAPRHLAVTGQPHQVGGELAHPGAVPPNAQSIGPLAVDETDGEGGLLGDLAGSGSGPVLVAAWDKVR